MSQEGSVNPDGHLGGHEQVSYSNTKIQLVVMNHVLDTDSAYKTYRRRMNDIGVNFFSRSSPVNNVLLVEDVSGNLESRIEAVNDSVKKFRSYRAEYWHMRGFKGTDVTEMIQLFERNPAELFLRMGRIIGIGDLASRQQAWGYGTLDALDSIRRKGFDVQLVAERRSTAIKQRNEVSGEDVFSWREVARLSQEADRKLAVQIENVISQNPERTRLLGVFGTAHAPIRESLPISLQQACEVVELNPKSDSVVLLHDIQRNNLTDEQIRQRISEIQKSGQFGK